VSGIEQETHQENDPQYNWENGPDGIGNIIDRILDPSDLGQNGTGNK